MQNKERAGTMTENTDIYEKAIRYLICHEKELLDIWDDPKSHPSGILFQAASKSGEVEWNDEFTSLCGDICEIASGDRSAGTKEITKLIVEDDRITVLGEDDLPELQPTEEFLSVFMEWQNLFDMTWNRDPFDKLKEWGFESDSLD